MTHFDWQGFYGPAYRLLLKQRSAIDFDEQVWKEALRLHEHNPVPEAHWEFLAVGYLHLFDRDDQLLPESARRIYQILPRFQRRPRTCNWRLMTQVVKARLSNRLLQLPDLAACGLSIADSGFLPDVPDDCSSQYHAYMLLLIMRFGDPCDEGLRSVVVHAIRWLVEVYLQHGDPSPIGRGRFQVFGYAAMAAVAGLAHRWNVSPNRQWESAVWSRSRPELPTGSLSAVWAGPHRVRLLHGYNTTDDYAAFAALWMSGLSQPEPMPTECRRAVCPTWWHALDRAGSGVLANCFGPIAVLLVDQHQRGDVGLRHLAKALLLQHRKPQSLERAPIRLEVADVFRTGGVMMTCLEDRITLRADPEHLAALLTIDSVTLWLSQPVPPPSLSGSCELERLTWQRTGTSTWHGLKVRLIRHGHFEVEWTP